MVRVKGYGLGLGLGLRTGPAFATTDCAEHAARIFVGISPARPPVLSKKKKTFPSRLRSIFFPSRHKRICVNGTDASELDVLHSERATLFENIRGTERNGTIRITERNGTERNGTEWNGRTKSYIPRDRQTDRQHARGYSVAVVQSCDSAVVCDCAVTVQ